LKKKKKKKEPGENVVSQRQLAFSETSEIKDRKLVSLPEYAPNCVKRVLSPSTLSPSDPECIRSPSPRLGGF